MDKPLVTIVYKTADGKRVRLEVSAEVRDLLARSDRQIRSQRRQDKRRHTEYADGITDTTGVLPHEDFADLIIRLDRHKRLHAAIGRLSEAQRRRLILHYFGGLTHGQIAKLDGVAPMTVTDSIHQARKKLRKMLNP